MHYHFDLNNRVIEIIILSSYENSYLQLLLLTTLTQNENFTLYLFEYLFC